MSFEYNAICDSCGFKRKASELRHRWDGKEVCADTCWETRNILDFYKPRNDTHKLPWTRPDSGPDGSWTPSVIVNITGTYSIVGSYIVDVNNVVTYRVVITPTTGTVTGASATLSLPTGTVSVDRKGVLTKNGTRVGQVTAGASLALPDFSCTASPPVSITISGSYTKA